VDKAEWVEVVVAGKVRAVDRVEVAVAGRVRAVDEAAAADAAVRVGHPLRVPAVSVSAQSAASANHTTGAYRVWRRSAPSVEHR